jgi:cyanate lyase
MGAIHLGSELRRPCLQPRHSQKIDQRGLHQPRNSRRGFRKATVGRHLRRHPCRQRIARAMSGNTQNVLRRPVIKREELTERILDIKRERDWTWKHITEEIGGMSPVLVVGALLGQMKLTKPLAAKAATLFGLSEVEQRMLNEIPMRGMPMPPTDPLLYRFYEMVMVNGPAWKALIEEEFGDGIMSAIDFDLQLERLANPKGDRVQLTMSGKFLPYKYYESEQGMPEYGFKEE